MNAIKVKIGTGTFFRSCDAPNNPDSCLHAGVIFVQEKIKGLVLSGVAILERYPELAFVGLPCSNFHLISESLCDEQDVHYLDGREISIAKDEEERLEKHYSHYVGGKLVVRRDEIYFTCESDEIIIESGVIALVDIVE